MRRTPGNESKMKREEKPKEEEKTQGAEEEEKQPGEPER